jgi:hypothetical protein
VVKYHGHHVALLRDVWPLELQVRRRETARLADLLGEDHDLAVLGALLRAAPGGFGRDGPRAGFLALLDRRRAELQAQAHPLGARLFAEPPAPFVARIDGYWAAWHSEDAGKSEE